MEACGGCKATFTDRNTRDAHRNIKHAGVFTGLKGHCAACGGYCMEYWQFFDHFKAAHADQYAAAVERAKQTLASRIEVPPARLLWTCIIAENVYDGLKNDAQLMALVDMAMDTQRKSRRAEPSQPVQNLATDRENAENKPDLEDTSEVEQDSPTVKQEQLPIAQAATEQGANLVQPTSPIQTAGQQHLTTAAAVAQPVFPSLATEPNTRDEGAAELDRIMAKQAEIMQEMARWRQRYADGAAVDPANSAAATVSSPPTVISTAIPPANPVPHAGLQATTDSLVTSANEAVKVAASGNTATAVVESSGTAAIASTRLRENATGAAVPTRKRSATAAGQLILRLSSHGHAFPTVIDGAAVVVESPKKPTKAEVNAGTASGIPFDMDKVKEEDDEIQCIDIVTKNALTAPKPLPGDVLASSQPAPTTPVAGLIVGPAPVTSTKAKLSTNPSSTNAASTVRTTPSVVATPTDKAATLRPSVNGTPAEASTVLPTVPPVTGTPTTTAAATPISAKMPTTNTTPAAIDSTVPATPTGTARPSAAATPIVATIVLPFKLKPAEAAAVLVSPTRMAEPVVVRIRGDYFGQPNAAAAGVRKPIPPSKPKPDASGEGRASPMGLAATGTSSIFPKMANTSSARVAPSTVPAVKPIPSTTAAPRRALADIVPQLTRAAQPAMTAHFSATKVAAYQQSGVVQSAAARAALLAQQEQQKASTPGVKRDAQGGTRQLAQTNAVPAPDAQQQPSSSQQQHQQQATAIRGLQLATSTKLDQSKLAAPAAPQQPTPLEPPIGAAAQTNSRGRQPSVGAGAAQGLAAASTQQSGSQLQNPPQTPAQSTAIAFATLVHALGKGARIMPPSVDAPRQSNAAAPAVQQQSSSSQQHPKRTAAQLAAAVITAQAKALAARRPASFSSERSAQHPPNPQVVGQRVSAQALAAMAAAGIAAQDAYASRLAAHASRPQRPSRQPNPTRVRDPCEDFWMGRGTDECPECRKHIPGQPNTKRKHFRKEHFPKYYELVQIPSKDGIQMAETKTFAKCIAMTLGSDARESRKCPECTRLLKDRCDLLHHFKLCHRPTYDKFCGEYHILHQQCGVIVDDALHEVMP